MTDDNNLESCQLKGMIWNEPSERAIHNSIEQWYYICMIYGWHIDMFHYSAIVSKVLDMIPPLVTIGIWSSKIKIEL